VESKELYRHLLGLVEPWTVERVEGACGYRNRDHFKIAVYFHCGGLNLYPARATHTKAG
jgi:hypothetical protein